MYKRQGAPSALQKLALDDDPMMIRSLEEQYLARVSGRAEVVVDVNHGLIGLLSRGKYSTGIFPTAAADPVDVKVVQGPDQRKQRSNAHT